MSKPNRDTLVYSASSCACPQEGNLDTRARTYGEAYRRSPTGLLGEIYFDVPHREEILDEEEAAFLRLLGDL